MFGFGSFTGMVLGGAGGSFLYRRDKRLPVLFAGTFAVFGCLPFWILLNYIDDTTSFPVLALVAGIAGLSASVTGPIGECCLSEVSDLAPSVH